MARAAEPIGTDTQSGVDRRGRPYVVKLHWAVIAGQLKVASVEISASGGVDASMLRDVPLAALAKEGRPGMAQLWREHDDHPELSDAERRRVRRVLAAARRPSEDPDVLELVASTYRRAHQEGGPPTKAVHEQLQSRGHEVSRQTAGKLVMRCRQLGLLGPAEPRRAGEKARTKRGATK